MPKGKALLQRWLAGDEPAFEAFYDLYSDMVFQLAMRMLQHLGEAEEVCQDVFLAAAEKANDFKGEAQTQTWLFAIATRKCLDVLRKRKQKKRLNWSSHFRETLQEDRWVDHLHPQANLEEMEQMQAFWSAWQQLPPRQKAALALVYLEGLPQQQAAEALQIQIKALESLLQRGKNNLKSFLEQRDSKESLKKNV